MFKNKEINKKFSYVFYVVIAILLVTILCCSVTATNVGHLDCCHVQNCCLCAIIQNAINVVNQLCGIIIYMCISGIVILLVCSISNIKSNVKFNTLINLQVQRNE